MLPQLSFKIKKKHLLARKTVIICLRDPHNDIEMRTNMDGNLQSFLVLSKFTDFVARSNISTNAKVGFDLCAFSAVIWAVWGEICMNLEKCFCFLFSFHLIQRAAHNLPLKSETSLLRLCFFFRLCLE